MRNSVCPSLALFSRPALTSFALHPSHTHCLLRTTARCHSSTTTTIIFTKNKLQNSTQNSEWRWRLPAGLVWRHLPPAAAAAACRVSARDTGGGEGGGCGDFLFQRSARRLSYSIAMPACCCTLGVSHGVMKTRGQRTNMSYKTNIALRVTHMQWPSGCSQRFRVVDGGIRPELLAQRRVYKANQHSGVRHGRF